MNIVICIKQVPDTQKVQVDPKTGVLIRNGIETKMNPYDLYALETALKIKEKTGATLHAITMGPPSAKEVLLEALALGADEVYLLSDRRFAGADVLATSYTLAQGIKKISHTCELILCGKQTTDGDTAQVGPAIAEWLNIPHVSWVKELVEIDVDDLVVRQEMMDSIATVKLPYPCLMTVEKGIYQPGLPSYIRKKEALKKEIHVMSLDDLEDLDETHYGLNGSPTQVERIFEPDHQQEVILLNHDTETNAECLLNKLLEMKVVKGGTTHGRNTH